MCKHLQVSASGYYEWRSRAPSARQLANAALCAQITQIHQASDATYGAPRVHAQLRHMGQRVNLKRVERLMRVMGLQGVSRRRGFVVTTKRNPSDRPAPDLVQRCFAAEDINQLWVADMTLYLRFVATSYRHTRRGQHEYDLRQQAWDIDVAPRLTFAPYRDRTVAKAPLDAVSLH